MFVCSGIFAGILIISLLGLIPFNWILILAPLWVPSAIKHVLFWSVSLCFGFNMRKVAQEFEASTRRILEKDKTS